MASHITRESVAAMTVATLRQELAKRALPVSGLKLALVQRLEEALDDEGHLAGPESGTSTPRTSHTTLQEQENEMSDNSSDDRGHNTYKRKRISEITDVLEPSDHVLVSLSQELKASRKEIERLQFQLEEAGEKAKSAKQEGKREAYQEYQKELFDMRSVLDVALRKREELEFKLSQKDDEMREYVASKQSSKQDSQHLKALKEEVKKRESLAFQCEQLKDQLEDYKQQVRSLQQKLETNQLHTEREKKESSRSLLEERGKAECMRVRMESQRDELTKEWRAEFNKQIEEQQEELKRQIREAKKLQKELKEKTLLLEDKMAERLKEELQRVSDMQADLAGKENQLRENDKLQEELDLALEQRQRSIDEEAARLESDKQDFEEKLQALEKERQEFEERLWTVDRDVKRRQDKEKALNDQIMELLAKNEALVAENARIKDTLSQQVKELTIENVRLQNSLALSQARVVSGRGITSSSSTSALPATMMPVHSETKEEAQSIASEATQETTSAGRQTRSQTQLARSQEQQARELLLSKTRSRPSYIPKPSTSRKVDISLPSSKPTTTTSTSNKENTHNNCNNTDNMVDHDPNTSSEGQQQARRQRVSMIPIRKGSTLLPQQQLKSLRS